MVGVDSCHAGIFDADLFSEQGDFLVGPVELGLESDAGVEAACSPTAGIGRGELGERNDMQDG